MTDFSRVLILSDLDFTFLARGSRMVERNLAAVERFKRKGGLFSIATGRGKDRFLKDVPEAATLLNAPAVLCNGAWLYDFSEGRTVGGCFLDPEPALSLVRFVESVGAPRVGVRVSTEEGYLTDADCLTPAIRADMRTSPCPARALPLDEWGGVTCAWLKAVIRGDARDIRAVRPLVEERFSEIFEFNASSGTYLEVQRKGCTKGTGLRDLQACLKERDPRLTVAIGDYENDIQMLLAADLSGCPSNAPDSVKAVSRLQLSDCDDGAVADMIEYLENEWTGI